MNRHWYKEAIVYSLDVRSFKDGNGDGWGDFRGLLDNLGYLSELGVNCLWILPFQPAGGRDNGYDITDYYAVDPAIGTLEEFRELVKKASDNNIRILMDLVVNHTSDKHPWFRDAANNKNSPFYNYYTWAKEKPADDSTHVIFKNVENSNWKYNPGTGEYYYHTFYSFQPDLNSGNPEVRKEISKIIRYWMGFGIAGFRVDALPHLLRKKTESSSDGDPFELIHGWNEVINEFVDDGVLIAEADLEPEHYDDYFGEKKVEGLLNFYGNNYFFYSLATKDPAPLAKAFETIPAPPGNGFYLNFIRNHDELDLERLTGEERQQVFDVFAPAEEMRIYDRGIRRRLQTMIHNSKEMAELCFSLLFSLPGTPVIRYGEEIGMGDELRLQERNSVRTAMQWTGEKNGGFTTPFPKKQVWPVISGGEYGYEKVNVQAQQEDSHSLLQCIKTMIRTYYTVPVFGYGAFKSLSTGHKQVMGHICQYDNMTAFALHNFSDRPATVRLVLEDHDFQEFMLILGSCMPEYSGSAATIKLNPYGYAWWSLKSY